MRPYYQSSNRTNILIEMVCTNRTNLHAGKYLITKYGIPNKMIVYKLLTRSFLIIGN